jgi:hypothetical protein
LDLQEPPIFFGKSEKVKTIVSCRIRTMTMITISAIMAQSGVSKKIKKVSKKFKKIKKN